MDNRGGRLSRLAVAELPACVAASVPEVNVAELQGLAGGYEASDGVFPRHSVPSLALPYGTGQADDFPRVRVN